MVFRANSSKPLAKHKRSRRKIKRDSRHRLINSVLTAGDYLRFINIYKGDSIGLPLMIPEADQISFLRAHKQLHISPMDKQPYIIDGQDAYIHIGKLHSPKRNLHKITPPFGEVGQRYYVQESFKLLKPVEFVPSISGDLAVLFVVQYKLDGFKASIQVPRLFINSVIDYEIDVYQHYSAMPVYLSRRNLAVHSHRIDTLQDISEMEAKYSGIEHVAGGFFFKSYKPDEKKPALKQLVSALESFKSNWEAKGFKYESGHHVWLSLFCDPKTDHKGLPDKQNRLDVSRRKRAGYTKPYQSAYGTLLGSNVEQ